MQGLIETLGFRTVEDLLGWSAWVLFRIVLVIALGASSSTFVYEGF